MISREYLEQRIQELTVARDKHASDVDANNGAIQFCQHLLDTIAVDEAAEIVKQADEAVKANGKDKAEEAAP